MVYELYFNKVVFVKVHVGYLFMSVAVTITVTHMFNAFIYNFMFLPCNTRHNLSPFPHSLPYPPKIYFHKSTQSAINTIKDSTRKSQYPQQRGLLSQVSPGLTSSQGLLHPWKFSSPCSSNLGCSALPFPHCLRQTHYRSCLLLNSSAFGSGYSNIVAKKNRIIFILLHSFCLIAAWYFILWMK